MIKRFKLVEVINPKDEVHRRYSDLVEFETVEEAAPWLAFMVRHHEDRVFTILVIRNNET